MANAAARSIEQLGFSQCDAGIQVIDGNIDATIILMDFNQPGNQHMPWPLL